MKKKGNYQRTETDVVIAIVRQVVVDVGKTTVVTVTTVQTVGVPENVPASFRAHCGLITLATVFYSASAAL